MEWANQTIRDVSRRWRRIYDNTFWNKFCTSDSSKSTSISNTTGLLTKKRIYMPVKPVQIKTRSKTSENFCRITGNSIVKVSGHDQSWGRWSRISGATISVYTSTVTQSVTTVRCKLWCVPVTSAPVERIFPQNGIILRPHRAKMSNELLGTLVFLKCNADMCQFCCV